MNFNFNENRQLDSEYKLARDTSAELINLYGVPISYIITEKVNQDDIFGENSHIKPDNEKIFNIFALPEETENWAGESDLFSKFGLQNMDTIVLYLSRTDAEQIHPELANREGRAEVNNLPNGNLVVFESGKIMEITDFELFVLGKNNIWTSKREKNVYKIILKTYFYNQDDMSSLDHTEVKGQDEYSDFGNLESIFGESGSDKEYTDKVIHRSEGRILQDEVIYPSEVRKKPVRIKQKEKNIFGEFG